MPAEFDSGHPFHFPIENDQAIRAAAHQFERLSPASGGGHLMPELRQNILQNISDDVIVVDN